MNIIETTLSDPKTKSVDSFLDQEMAADQQNEQSNGEGTLGLLKYLVVGLLFGIIFVKAEIISWFRIQEMFRLQSFYMYGVIGSAVVVGMLSVFLIRKFNVKTLAGEEIKIAPKFFHQGQIYGGVLFGLGWALTGACPGPLFAQIGSGYLAVIVTLLSAILGTWTYGATRKWLPH